MLHHNCYRVFRNAPTGWHNSEQEGHFEQIIIIPFISSVDRLLCLISLCKLMSYDPSYDYTMYHIMFHD